MSLEPSSPVNLEPVLSDEKLAHLLALQAEYPELDYKGTIDLTTTRGLVELAKDVGAMSVRGAFIVGGVDNGGVPTGAMDELDLSIFDEARLVPKLHRYLPDSLELVTRVLERDGHKLVIIYVAPNPSGCAVFRADGQYEKEDGTLVVKFRAGEIFWRDGTRSVRLTQRGFEEVMRRRLEREKLGWLREQQELRREEFEQRAEASREAQPPFDRRHDALFALGIAADVETLTQGAVELARQNDLIGLQHLLIDARRRARELFEQDDFEDRLDEVLDKLGCLAATFLQYEQDEWFERVVDVLAAIYNLGIDANAKALDYQTQISREEKRVRLWLLVIRRVYAIGGLAVRLRRWNAVRTLTLQRPEALGDYYTSWLRHALTMASRARLLHDEQRELFLLRLARDDAERLACLRPDGVAGDAEELLTSIAQFDLLSNLVAIATAGSVDGSVFYTNFAPFRTERVEPAVLRLLVDEPMRAQIFPLEDVDLAVALKTINDRARSEGFRFRAGFFGFYAQRINDFITEHEPETPA